VGRPNYDRFRAAELPDILTEVRRFSDAMRIHEMAPGEKGGRPPASRRDLLKTFLFLEKARVPIPESTGWLHEFQDLLGLDHVYCPRTLYKYRGDLGITKLLHRAIRDSARPLWLKESIAGIDASGIPRLKGQNWSDDREKPERHELYDKLHILVGTKTGVIAAARTTFGNWHDSPQFVPLVQAVEAWENIRALTADAGNMSRANCAAAKARGVTPYIDPRGNAVLRSQPSDPYEAMVSFERHFPNRWHEQYRWRTKLESMFHAVKAAMVEGVRGKSATSRRNQVLTRCVVHNLRMRGLDRYAT
jgi:hypothetical protein